MPRLVAVTHHALLRYLERVRGFNFDREVAEIRKICAGVENGTVKAHGCQFEVKDGRVVTVSPIGVNATKRREVAAMTIKR